MAATESAAGTLENLTGSVGAESPSGGRVQTYRRPEQVAPRNIPAEAVERIRERLEQIGTGWSPSVEIDVEEMLRRA